MAAGWKPAARDEAESPGTKKGASVKLSAEVVELVEVELVVAVQVVSCWVTDGG